MSRDEEPLVSGRLTREIEESRPESGNRRCEPGMDAARESRVGDEIGVKVVAPIGQSRPAFRERSTEGKDSTIG